jgi:ABC-type nitrate/sulfonate/bicarbonate transport system substrate-binding protein
MCLKKYLSIVLLIIIAIFSVKCSKKDSIILQREWFANSEFVGDIWASKIASEKGLTLQVKEGSELLDPVRLVRSGDVHFGVASADRVLQENEGGAQLMIIASATYKTPVVFLSKTKSQIFKPVDFIDKKVGIQAGTNTELVLDAIIHNENLDKEKIRIVESGWGIQTLRNDDIDVLGAFDYDERIQLEMHKVKYNKIDPEESDVKYVGTVYFTRKSLIEEEPDVVQDFISYLVAGWENAIDNPDEAISFLVEYNSNIDREKEKLSLSQGIKYFQGENNHLLFSSKERWMAMAESLIELGKLNKFIFEENIDYTFLEIALSKREAK